MPRQERPRRPAVSIPCKRPLVFQPTNHVRWPEECGNRLFAIPFACLSLHEPARRPEHGHVYGTAHLASSVELPSHDGPCPGPSRE